MKFSTATLLTISALIPSIFAKSFNNTCACGGTVEEGKRINTITSRCCGGTTFTGHGLKKGTFDGDACNFSANDDFVNNIN
ncbi:hypothetical protein MCOR29_011101, partial [Pyricularia oryzae]